MTGLRDATAADLDAVMAIERASFPTDAWSRDAMRRSLLDHDAVALVATADDDVVGYAVALAPAGTGDADVLTIAVDAAWRHTGIGRSMIQRLIDGARARGARRVFLEVRVDNEVAQRLYRSFGFVAIGRRRGYYQPDGVDALTMRLELPAVAG